MMSIGDTETTEDYFTQIDQSVFSSKELMKKFTLRCKEMNYKYRVVLEDAVHSIGHMICDVANQFHASSIIMGQRGLGKFQRALHGSVSSYVLHHAKIPVLVIPTK